MSSAQPNIFKITQDLTQGRWASFAIQFDSPVTKNFVIGSNNLPHGAVWQFMGLWLLVYTVVHRGCVRPHWDWTLSPHFSLTYRSARRGTSQDLILPVGTRILDAHREGPPAALQRELRNLMTRRASCLGVDGVPFSLHLLEDPVARQAAITAYLKENPTNG